jgi:isoleucyl-tRNA synthetase
MVLALRKKVNIRVRQPLNKILLPVLDETFQSKIESVKDLILAEVNVKQIEYINDTSGILVKKIKPNFKVLGKKVGTLMKVVATAINNFSQDNILLLESEKKFDLKIEGQIIALKEEDVEILSEDIPGWQVINDGKLTVALDITITEKLREEGIAREFVNRIQNIRKDKGFDVTDKIDLKVLNQRGLRNSLINNKDYICAEILANSFEIVDSMPSSEAVNVEVADDISTLITIHKN